MPALFVRMYRPPPPLCSWGVHVRVTVMIAAAVATISATGLPSPPVQRSDGTSLQNNSVCAVLHNNSCWYNPGGHVVSSFHCESVTACCTACDKLASCLAFTMNFGDSTCYLKDGKEISKHAGNCTSGGEILPPPPPAPPTPLPPAPKGAKK